jgi:ABC-type uncharacterized transport system permease subunit
MGLATMDEIAKGILILGIWIFVFMQGVKLLWKKGQYKYTGVGI